MGFFFEKIHFMKLCIFYEQYHSGCGALTFQAKLGLRSNKPSAIKCIILGFSYILIAEYRFESTPTFSESNSLMRFIGSLLSPREELACSVKSDLFGIKIASRLCRYHKK